MGASDSDLSRLFAGDEPTDDPGLREVAGFLTVLRTNYPPVPVDSLEQHHLAAIREEARRVAVARRTSAPRSRRVRRTAVVSVVAALGMLSAGVGVATAMGGGDPLTLLPGVRLGQPAAPRSATVAPDPTTPPTSAAAGPRSVAPSGVGLPTTVPSPTVAPGESGEEHGKSGQEHGKSGQEHGKSGQEHGGAGAKSNNGKSEVAKASHKPTPKPSAPGKGREAAPGQTRSSSPRPSSVPDDAQAPG